MKKQIFLIFSIPILVLFLVFLTISNLKMYYKRKDIGLELEYFKSKAEQIQQEKDLIQARILESQLPEHLERTAREELNLQKPGEKVVAFPLVISNATTSAPAPVVQEKSFFQKILDFISF